MALFEVIETNVVKEQLILVTLKDFEEGVDTIRVIFESKDHGRVKSIVFNASDFRDTRKDYGF